MAGCLMHQNRLYYLVVDMLGWQTSDLQSKAWLSAMTLPGYFWDRWPSLAGKPSWDVTIIQVNSALHFSGVAVSSTSFGWGKGGKVTAAGWFHMSCDFPQGVKIVDYEMLYPLFLLHMPYTKASGRAVTW